MAVNYNAGKIVTDGLVLCLDAGNPKNYNLTEVEYLIVAGGGSGGNAEANPAGDGAGGGGAGGVLTNIGNPLSISNQSYTIVVGGGGVNASGGNSSAFGLTAFGGGKGGNLRNGSVASGGSGGGAGGNCNQTNRTGGAGTSGQGNRGGNDLATNASCSLRGGRGGGGAGSAAADTASSAGTSGGNGIVSYISGTETYYGGGGGGGRGAYSQVRGAGGLGGGGNGSNGTSVVATAGSANTGGGGGGGGSGQDAGAGAAGGSGIVIVRYPGPQKAIGGTVTSVAGHTIHTFTTVGSTTFTPLVATNNSAILGLSDFSGNNNFGTAVNSPVFSSANGGSIVFDGTNDYVTTGFTRGTLGNYLTLTAWYKYTGTSGRTYSAIIGGKEVSAGTEFFIGKHTGNTNIGVQDGNYSSGFVTGSNAFDGNWHQIVYSYNNGTGRIYLDGVLKNTGSFTKCNDAEEIIIGGEIGSVGLYFDGNISRVSFYNRTLSAQEISQNYNATKSRFQ